MLGGQKEESLPASRYVIHAMSLLAGGFMAGRKSGSRGWYAGGMTGLAYSAIISLTGFLGFDKGVDWTSVWFTVGAFLAGALGGMTGVQTKK
ncbi:TIGR04086 family membrane protein [Paenibacillus sp. CC-CFT747]|nr:TIGR04086 family membrane protein [Paenibacillus sp. CC-CFT747]